MTDMTLDRRTDTSEHNSLRTKIEEAHANGHVTGQEAADIVGATYRRVDYAARQGVAPPLLESEGSGTIRRYDLTALVRLRIAIELSDFGVRSTDQIRRVLDEIEVSDDNVRVVLGCLTVEVDTERARQLIEPAYLATINPDPKD